MVSPSDEFMYCWYSTRPNKKSDGYVGVVVLMRMMLVLFKGRHNQYLFPPQRNEATLHNCFFSIWLKNLLQNGGFICTEKTYLFLTQEKDLNFHHVCQFLPFGLVLNLGWQFN